MKYNRFLPLILPILVFLLLEIYIIWPSQVLVVASFSIFLYLITARQFVRNSQIEEKWWNIIILPGLLTLGTIAFSLLLSNFLIIQFMVILNSLFLHFYLRAIYYLLDRKQEISNYSLENLSSYGNFLSFYFISSAIFGFQAFLHIRTWILMLVLLLAAGLTVYQVFWANRINLKPGFFYILLYGLVLIEIAWAISFLSLSFYILGLILAICYYILIGLARFHLLGKLNANLIKLYLLFGLSSIFIVLFTSRWL